MHIEKEVVIHVLYREQDIQSQPFWNLGELLGVRRGGLGTLAMQAIRGNLGDLLGVSWASLGVCCGSGRSSWGVLGDL